ncbi:hypothetical protein KIN20_000214 [Parelaphostrongylus tenuis]|uniref:Uncharacterized protein n=1 Tax=Parelaphostrongylus tenuis TaxID=148309 RepID=A0AAD5MB07_PARTN|nr:hypothetical protein KIN20_000214 [Parelaphostrongylus tenuis]
MTSLSSGKKICTEEMKWGVCEIVDNDRRAQHHPQYLGAVRQRREIDDELLVNGVATLCAEERYYGSFQLRCYLLYFYVVSLSSSTVVVKQQRMHDLSSEEARQAHEAVEEILHHQTHASHLERLLAEEKSLIE